MLGNTVTVLKYLSDHTVSTNDTIFGSKPCNLVELVVSQIVLVLRKLLSGLKLNMNKVAYHSDVQPNLNCSRKLITHKIKLVKNDCCKVFHEEREWE